VHKKQSKDGVGPGVELPLCPDLLTGHELELEGTLLMRSPAIRRRMKRALEQLLAGRGVSLETLVQQVTLAGISRTRKTRHARE
jgi:hypothetical protein